MNSQRYDIRPNPDGGWNVVDTANGYGAVASYPTRKAALDAAIRISK
tara:strand:+ start:1185 stop:1325 length:141 start_codon:yes stop_codon:yes gene_type:complete